MNKRAFILCASFGTLVLSAAPITGHWDRTDLGAEPAPSEETMAAPASEDTNLELLKAAYTSTPTPAEEATVSPMKVDESTLWLARAIYSETKVPHEQELVAWVIRNRVRTNYRGKSTYRDVVLDPYQFSAFNPGSSKRQFHMHLSPETDLASWQETLWIAHYVRHAEPVYRPFSVETRHFYSERSMQGRRMPFWADGSRFVSPGWNYAVDERRFRFFEKIS